MLGNEYIMKQAFSLSLTFRILPEYYQSLSISAFEFSVFSLLSLLRRSPRVSTNRREKHGYYLCLSRT
jgi:hypothetical protein